MGSAVIETAGFVRIRSRVLDGDQRPRSDRGRFAGSKFLSVVLSHERGHYILAELLARAIRTELRGMRAQVTADYERTD